ncbi:MAG TPA: hypothetical protein VLV78_04400 [Thermoanaerobaculia bacterium]|nr:hypothetical protein [Thermoanaerobaculia bacterium]
MRISIPCFAILSSIVAAVAGAQTIPAPATPPLLSDTAASAYDRKETLPTLNVYLPEGQASVRLRKLIKNVLFESQIDYRFVTGDISTFLRYKYYAKNLTYRLGVFDEISFPDIGSKSTNEFQRVRGGLLLFGFPRDYNHRYFYLLQDDRLTFGDLTNVDNKKNNIYMKVGYQFGTQFDERMNAIVGESRGRITPVLTAFRDIGPQKTGLAAALTESLRVSTGDYRYTKFEAEGLHRTDITQRSFIFSRLHFGAFFGYDKCDNEKRPCPGGQDVPEIERYSIPRYDMMQLGGRNALKAIGSDVEATGTHEIHLTNEYFVPIFRNKDFKTWLLHWNTMYGIGYLGAGTVGFKYNQLFKSAQAVVDAGLGSEMALTVRDYDVLLSVVYARTLHAPTELEGSKIRFFIRTVR